MRTIKIREWINRRGHAGWQFNCGRNEKGQLEQWRIYLDGCPTIEDARRAVDVIDQYWRDWNRRGLAAWTHDHKVLAQEAAGIWPSQRPDLDDKLRRFYIETLDKARWRVEQEEKAKRDARENANRWEDYARGQMIHAVNIASQVGQRGVHYVVSINLSLLNPPPATIQLSLYAPISQDS